MNIGQQIATSILAKTKPDSSKLASHAGNWPLSAEYAVEYKYHDRQFPDVRHEWEVEYFDNKDQLDKWVASKHEFVMRTDYDFTVNCKIYQWDLGPELINVITI